MPATTLIELLTRNAQHTAAIPPYYFSSVQDEQRPAVVSVCCSDSRVSQEGMWSVDEPNWLFTPSTIGNQVWDRYDDERVVDGSVLYPMVQTDTQLTTVVGHTGCGAITAAVEHVQTGDFEAPPGIQKWIDMLVPVIEAGFAENVVDPNDPVGLVNQFVELNVDQQVAFLKDSDDVPANEELYGFVYDLHSIYGEQPGRVYLVNANGETDIDELRNLVPDQFQHHVHRLNTPSL